MNIYFTYNMIIFFTDRLEIHRDNINYPEMCLKNFVVSLQPTEYQQYPEITPGISLIRFKIFNSC